MSSYQEALAKQRGKKFARKTQDDRRAKKRALTGIPCYARPEVPEGTIIFLQRTKFGMIPCAHIQNGEEHGDLLNASVALISKASLLTKEAANDCTP